MIDQIKENKLVMLGVLFAGLLIVFLVAESIVKEKNQLALRVNGLEKQSVEVANLSQQIKEQGGGLSRNNAGGTIKALLPWLEKRFSITKMTDQVENMSPKSNIDASYKEVVNFRLNEISMNDLLPLLQQFDHLSELRLVKADISRASTQGIVFDAELALLN